MDESRRLRLVPRLQSYNAVVFGVDDGCEHTAKMKRDWKGAIGKEIHYFPCDASPAAEATCARSGISTTPTLAFGGVQYPGHVPAAKIEELLDLADAVGEGLKERNATLFVRGKCGWCDRQMATLGPNASKVEIVNCDAESARCAKLGIRAMPAWQLGGGGDKGGGAGASSPDGVNASIQYGYHPLPGLQQLLLQSRAAAPAGGKL